MKDMIDLTHWQMQGFPDDQTDHTLQPHIFKGEKRITIWSELGAEEGTFPCLTLEQAKQLRWALNKSIKELEKANTSEGLHDE